MFNNGRVSDFDNVSWSVGDKLHLVFRWRKTGNIQTLHINGINQVPTATSGTWADTALGADVHIFQRFSSVERLDGSLHLARIYRKIINVSRIPKLAADPLGFLRLAEPAPFFVPAVAGTELFEIPHYMRGGFNPMHGGFSA